MLEASDGMSREETIRKEEKAMRWANRGRKPACKLGHAREKAFVGPRVDLGWSWLLLGSAVGWVKFHGLLLDLRFRPTYRP